MSQINKPIAENIDENYIETYLTKQGLKRSDDETGIPIVDFVNKLLVSGKLNVEDFEEFLFHELLLGKRKLIRVYKLNSLKKIKYPDDWIEILAENIIFPH